METFARMESEVLNSYLPPLNLTMSSKSVKCGEVFMEDTLTLTLVCALCGKKFTEMEQFGAHITCAHLPSEKLESLLLQTVKEEITIEEDPFQDGKSIYESADAICDEISDEMDDELIRIKVSQSSCEIFTEPISANSTGASQIIVNRSSSRKRKILLEPGKWTDFCSKCGIKFKNKDDFATHMKLKHSYISNEEKALLEKKEASIIYVAHVCPMCPCHQKHRNGFAKHLKEKHNLDPEHIKTILKEEFSSTRNCAKAGQTSTKGDSSREGHNTLHLQMKHNAEQVQTNVQKQQSEAVDPEPFGADSDSQAIKQPHENLSEFLTASKNMETTNSIPGDIGVMDEMFETEMDVARPEMQSHDSKNTNLWAASCSICGVKFKYKREYELHAQLIHSNCPAELNYKSHDKYLDVLVHAPIVCSICGLNFKNKDFFADHLKRKHNMELGKCAALTMEESQNSCSDSNEEHINANRTDASQINVNRSSSRKLKRNIEQGKWTDFCSKCGVKFKNNDDFAIHMKLKHSYISNEEKALLEKKEASIIYVAHSCPMCSCKQKHRNGFAKHLKVNHHLNSKRIKSVLAKEFWSTRVSTKVNQTSEQGESWRKGHNRVLLQRKRNMQQMQTKVQKQQSEAMDPVPFEADGDSQAVKQSRENLSGFLTATKNMETTNSIPEADLNDESQDKYLDVLVHVPIVCSICGLSVKNKDLFADHLKLMHNMELGKIAALTLEESQNYRVDSKQDEHSVYESGNASIDQMSDEMDDELMRIKEPIDATRTDASQIIVNGSSFRNRKRSIEQGKWTDFCSKCGVKFKNNDDFAIHMKLKHSYISNEEKALLEKKEASIIYVAHSCPMCSCKQKHRNGFAKHLKVKHHLNSKRIKAVLTKEFWSTRGSTKAYQTSGKGESWRKWRNKLLLQRQRNEEQMQTKVQKQQSEAIDSESFGANDESQAIKQSNENLSGSENMETNNSIPEDIEIKKEIFETEMDASNKNIINTPQTTNQTASNVQPEMQSDDTKNTNLWVAFCSTCGVKFRYKLGYELHVQLKHNNCPVELEDELENKYSDVLVHVPIVCTICGLNFKCKNLFADHLKLKHDMELGEIAALTLEERQNSRADSNQMTLIEQLLKPDLVKDVEAALRQCQEKAESEIKPEIVKEHSKRNFCTECNRQFERTNAYNFHMRVKHGILTKNYREKFKSDKYAPSYDCEYCGKVFHTTGDHKYHVALHRRERNHKCPHCPKAFTHPANLRCHIRIHLNIKRFKCSYCISRFVTNAGRREHERSHTKEGRFQCKDCGNLYPNAYLLRDHMLAHKNIKTYKCGNCDKKFTTRACLWGHSQKHKGDKFKCEHCERIFTSKRIWKNHVLLHSDQKKYVCNICGKAFAQFSGLYSHRKSHKMTQA